MAEKMGEDELRELLDYCAETGVFTWKARACVAFDAKYAGTVAGSILTCGYRAIKISKQPYLAARLAWLYVHGVHPAGQIDHINGKRDDNRICNLRDISQTANLRNKRIYTNNKSGAVGVAFYEPTQRWRSSIRVNGKVVSLGYFRDKEKAIAARKKAEADFGFHLNHGRAA